VTPPHAPPSYDEQDPFDLPGWLGESEVTWQAETALDSGHLVLGTLSVLGVPGHDAVPCDLLAVDDAYPEPVADEGLRVRCHQVWRHGEVLVAVDRSRTLLVVPGSRLDTAVALEAIARLARAVGATRPWSVLLRVGR
jgi:hypothetical protein